MNHQRYAQTLLKRTEHPIKIALEQTAEEIKKAWRYYIQTEFYDQYKPERYKRTFQLLESLVITEVYKELSGYWKIAVYMDPEPVVYKHDSPWLVWDWAAQGVHGYLNNDGSLGEYSVQTDGRFYESILEDLQAGVFTEILNGILSKFGLKVTKR